MPAFTSHYARIVADLTNQIDSGQLQPKQQLPTTTELAKQYGVSPTTVRNAIRFLIGTGVLYGHQGIGVFVAVPLERPAKPSAHEGQSDEPPET